MFFIIVCVHTFDYCDHNNSENKKTTWFLSVLLRIWCVFGLKNLCLTNLWLASKIRQSEIQPTYTIILFKKWKTQIWIFARILSILQQVQINHNIFHPGIYSESHIILLWTVDPLVLWKYAQKTRVTSWKHKNIINNRFDLPEVLFFFYQNKYFHISFVVGNPERGSPL